MRRYGPYHHQILFLTKYLQSCCSRITTMSLRNLPKNYKISLFKCPKNLFILTYLASKLSPKSYQSTPTKTPKVPYIPTFLDTCHNRNMPHWYSNIVHNKVTLTGSKFHYSTLHIPVDRLADHDIDLQNNTNLACNNTAHSRLSHMDNSKSPQSRCNLPADNIGWSLVSE